MVQAGVSFSCSRLFLFISCLFLHSLLVFSSLALRFLPPFLSLLVSLSPPLASFSLFSLSRSFSSRSLFASLSSLSFLLSYFLRTGCCHNNKGKSTRTENRTEKIIDNSGWVWLTGVNRASLNGAEPSKQTFTSVKVFLSSGLGVIETIAFSSGAI